MKNIHYRNWIVARKLINGENETQTYTSTHEGGREKGGPQTNVLILMPLSLQ